jgi:acyl-coenzyme A thioesterase PaaI-like protein
MTVLPEDRYAVTADVHTQLIRPIRASARVELAGRVLRAGRRLAFCEAGANVDGEICALARMTKAIVPAPY